MSNIETHANTEITRDGKITRDDGETKIVVNPYNFNNQFITEREVSILFKRFNIHFEPMNINLYRQAFTHKSFTKKNSKKLRKVLLFMRDQKEQCHYKMPIMKEWNILVIRYYHLL